MIVKGNLAERMGLEPATMLIAILPVPPAKSEDGCGADGEAAAPAPEALPWECLFLLRTLMNLGHFCAIGERLAVAGSAGLVGRDDRGICH